MSRLALSLALAIGAASPAPATAQVCPGSSWMLRAPSMLPVARSGHGLVFDTARSRAVLFGGQSSASLLSDTWEWNGAAQSWTIRVPGGSPPAPRYGHAMVFDSARARTLLFGGASPGLLADTWEWDGVGASWTLRTPSGVPSARTGAAMAFDPVRNVVVLFGGSDAAPRADTWEFNSAGAGGAGVWTLRTPTAVPPARDQHAMTFDAARGRVVMFGGSASDAAVWEWDPSGAGAWTARHASTEPPARAGCGLAFDAARSRVVLFGGAAGTTMYNDTWEWNGLSGIWSQRAPSSPPASRSRAGFVFDPSRGLFLLYGGRSTAYLNDTWELSSGAAPSISQQPANRTVAFGGSTTLSVSAAGSAPLAYRWRRNGQALDDGLGLIDTHTATLSINPAADTHAGAYDCVVSDGCGGVLSAPAIVTVTTGCAADFDHNGLIQPADVALFVNTCVTSLSNGTLAGDFDGNGVIQPADIAAYVNAWFTAATTGC